MKMLKIAEQYEKEHNKIKKSKHHKKDMPKDNDYSKYKDLKSGHKEVPKCYAPDNEEVKDEIIPAKIRKDSVISMA